MFSLSNFAETNEKNIIINKNINVTRLVNLANDTKIQEIIIKPTNFKDKVSYYPSLDSPFLPKAVSKEIKKLNYKCSFDLGVYKFQIFNYDSSIDKYINIITSLYSVMYYLYSINPIQGITFNIFLTDVKKLWPSVPNSVIGPDNCNSGWSMGKEIVIFRKEEFSKVIIHDLIHSLKIYSSLTKNQFKNLCLDGIDYPNEAFTEFWAIFYHSIWISKINKIPFSKVISNEIYFSLHQASFLIKYWNLENECKNNIIDTSCYSYYIVKTCFLVFNDKYIDTLVAIKRNPNQQKLPEINVNDIFPLLNTSFFKSARMSLYA
jgi:hypothetical protein